MSEQTNNQAGADNQASRDYATEQPSADQWRDHLEKLAEHGQQLYHDHIEQAKLCQQMAVSEWNLTKRSLALTIILLVSFAGGLVLMWAGLLITLGLAIFSLSGSVWLSAFSLLALQVLCLAWLWRNINYVSNKIGFSKTLHCINQLFSSNNKAN